MSMPDQDEMQFLRRRLQGALADIATLEGTIAALRDTLRARDELNEHVTNERDRLREEKRQFHNWILEKDR